MTSTSITINDKVTKRIQEFARALEPSKREVINEKLSIQLQGIVFRNFSRQQGEGKPWQPLKDKTLSRKRKKGYRKILQNTGALRASFLPFSDANIAGVGGKSFTGKDRPADLAAIHQYGVPSKNIPARPMLPSQDQAVKSTIVIYNREIKLAKEKAGL